MSAVESREPPQPVADERQRRVVAGFAAGVVLASALGFGAAYLLGARPGATTSPRGSEVEDDTTVPLTASEAHATGAALPAVAAELVANLEARLRDNPADTAARRQLAVVLVENEAWVAAFDHARALRRADPADPDGLYVEGIVRMRMGQNREGIELLDELLATRSDHVEAWLAKGLGLLRSGDSEGAIVAWQTGLDSVGGAHPELERMLAISRAAIDEKARTGAGGQLVSSLAADPRAIAAPAAASAPGAAGTFVVNVDLPPGFAAPERSTLFLSLGGEPGSPPVLVKRIASPRFPLVARLTAADAMLGGDLPRSGLIRARLDGDGNATTRDDSDLEGSASGELGTATSIALRPGGTTKPSGTTS